MAKKNDYKNHLYIIITGVVAITLIWLSQSNKNEGLNLESLLEKNIANNNEGKTVGALEGSLWASDNESKGNLMLVTSNATVYIRTSRDFARLTGKYVVASIDGTLENFTLLNIEEGITKDGYIKAQ